LAGVDTWTTVLVPLGVAVIPSLLTYFGTQSQTKKALETAQIQQNLELQKVKEQQQADLEKLKEQQQAEIQKLREQHHAELQRMREQTELDIEKMKFEMEKQAENYEKIAQIDVTKGFFEKMIAGDSSPFEAIASGLEQLQKIQERVDKK
jgi:biopolymer transport protein ExbB/TolQ